MGEYIGKVTAVQMRDDYNVDEIKEILEPSQYKDYKKLFEVWDGNGWIILWPGDYVVRTGTGKIHVFGKKLFESIFSQDKT